MLTELVLKAFWELDMPKLVSYRKFFKKKSNVMYDVNVCFSLKCLRNEIFYFFLRKSIKKLEDCRLPFLNILLGSRVTKL